MPYRYLIWKVLTTRFVGWHTAMCRLMYMDISCLAHVIIYVHIWRWGWFGWHVLYVEWYGWWIDYWFDFGGLLLLLSLYILYLDLWVMLGIYAMYGTLLDIRSTYGSCLIFCRIYAPIWKIKSYFQRKSIGSKMVYFIYSFSCCETFSQ